MQRPVNEHDEVLTELNTILSAAGESDRKYIARAIAELGGLLLRKNSNYGSSALNSPIMAPDVSALSALLIRESDKIARRLQLGSGNPDLVGESLVETEKDHAGYLILRYALRLKTAAQTSRPMGPARGCSHE